MRAMILAAGLGTRLRPLTDSRPKALVELNGRTLLEIALTRLKAFGIRDVIINVHHFADMVVEYLRAKKDFGLRVEISREDLLLDTGGGLKKASWFLIEEGGGSDEPFLLHNVDVVSSVDFGRMVQFHKESCALATLAVQDRQTGRYLLFDDKLQLCGRRRGREGEPEFARKAANAQGLAFSGIHVISPRLLELMTEEGVFSIIDVYLRLAGTGERILAFRADEYYWRDLGKPENLTKAAEELKQETFPG